MEKRGRVRGTVIPQLPVCHPERSEGSRSSSFLFPSSTLFTNGDPPLPEGRECPLSLFLEPRFKAEGIRRPASMRACRISPSPMRWQEEPPPCSVSRMKAYLLVWGPRFPLMVLIMWPKAERRLIAYRFYKTNNGKMLIPRELGMMKLIGTESAYIHGSTKSRSWRYISCFVENVLM